MEHAEYTEESLRTCISSELSISSARYWGYRLSARIAQFSLPISRTNYRRWAMGIGLTGLFLGALISLLSLNTRGDDAALVLVVDPPTGLRVVMNGATLVPDSTSPLRVAHLAPGKHVVTIEKEGYHDRQIDVEIESGKGLSRAVLLKKLDGGVALSTEPAGATVWIDGRPLEVKTPLVVRGIAPGTRMVRIAKGNAYAPIKIPVDVQADKVTKVPRQRLQRRVVEVSFESRPAGAVAHLITGKTKTKLGRTPVKAVIDFARHHRVRFDLQGYHSAVKHLDADNLGVAHLSPGEVLVAEVVLRAEIEKERSESGESAEKSP